MPLASTKPCASFSCVGGDVARDLAAVGEPEHLRDRPAGRGERAERPPVEQVPAGRDRGGVVAVGSDDLAALVDLLGAREGS